MISDELRRLIEESRPIEEGTVNLYGYNMLVNYLAFNASAIADLAEEYWCAMKRLDALDIPRVHEGKILSLVGRINKATNTF